MVGATSRPSLMACDGSRNQGTVVTVSTHRVIPVPTSRGGNTRNTLTMRSHVSPTMASRRITAMARWGSLAASSATRRPPIECPTRTAGPTPEVVEHPPEQRRVAGHALRSGGEAERAPVARGVHGDDLEAEVDQARQGLGVEDPLGREPVDDHERHAPTADGHADGVTVVERDRVTGEPGEGDVDLVGRLRAPAR